MPPHDTDTLLGRPHTTMPKRKPTQKQAAVLDFIMDFLAEKRAWPTYRQMQEHFGWSSPNSVTQNLEALRKKGYLKRGQHHHELSEKAFRRRKRLQRLDPTPAGY